MMGCEQIEDDIIDCSVAIIATFTPATAQLRLWVPRLLHNGSRYKDHMGSPMAKAYSSLHSTFIHVDTQKCDR